MGPSDINCLGAPGDPPLECRSRSSSDGWFMKTNRKGWNFVDKYVVSALHTLKPIMTVWKSSTSMATLDSQALRKLISFFVAFNIAELCCELFILLFYRKPSLKNQGPVGDLKYNIMKMTKAMMLMRISIPPARQELFYC